MKKSLVLLLVLGVLLTALTGCELFAPDQTQRPNYATGGGGTEPSSTPNDGTEPPADDNYGFTVFPEGNYLADPMFDTDEFLPDYDADPSFINFLSTHSFPLCANEDTIYSCGVAYNRDVPLILYTDKATGETNPLCGRPECLHSDSTCNAYTTSAKGLSIYDGKLYWVDGGYKIARANLDGTDRETVASAASAYGSIGNDFTNVFHRGYLYVAGSKHEVIVDGVRMGSVTVSAQPLDGSKGFTILQKTVDGRGPECLIKPVGNDLYIMLYYFNYADEDKKEGSYETVEFYRWDTKTRQVEFIASTQSTPGGMKFQGWSFNPIPGDGIYFQAYFSATDGEYLPDNIIYKYSFETGTFEEGARIDNSHWLSYCKDFIITYQYHGNDTLVYAYNYDGSVLYKSDPSAGGGNIIGADDDFAYFYGTRYVAVPLKGGESIVIEEPVIIKPIDKGR